MLGLLRFILALLVVGQHLGDDKPWSWSAHTGVYAVFGFYVLSGYLMTAILNDAYSFRLGPFALNRFLRLFPIYYAVAVATLIVIYLVPAAPTFMPAWTIRYRWTDLIGNALIFPFVAYDQAFRLVPPSWSIAVELVNYFLLWLVVARNRWTAFGVALLALAYHVYTFVSGADWSRRYFPFYAALLPFALGACVYFMKDLIARLSPSRARLASAIVFALWLGNLLISSLNFELNAQYFGPFFYFNTVSIFALVACLSAGSMQSILRRTGKALGDLAYPIFLTHWIVAFCVSLLLFGGRKAGLPLLATSIIPILVVSYILSWLANRWLEPVRNIVRSSVGNRERGPEPQATTPDGTGAEQKAVPNS